jgi:hypothetical protein
MIICLACYMVGYISAHYSTRDYVAHEMVRATPFYFIFHFSLHNFLKKSILTLQLTFLSFQYISIYLALLCILILCYLW